MKKEIIRLQRWLDRLSEAYNRKKWDSALAEADCLSAELREFRDELWQKTEENICEEKHRFSFTCSLSRVVRTAAVTVVVLCASTLPIAVESNMPHNVAALPVTVSPKSEQLAIITQEEKELLQELRKNLDSGTVTAAKLNKNTAGSTAKKITAKKQSVKHPAQNNVAAQDPMPKTAAEKPKQSAKTLNAEDLLTLVHIGEKHLRNENSAIKIID